MQHTFTYDAGTARAETTGGPVRGYCADGLSVFKGIPYARARRFRQPEPARWDSVLDCTSYGAVCPLLSLEPPRGEVKIPHRYWPMSEDCLNLNLWTPGCDAGRRPVLVWLHGGAFSDGSAIEQAAYDGSTMARLGDAVVVTVNHRLNILGYFDLSAFGPAYENSGNAGTADIIAALRWVQANIARFGGDPANVTVFGQSGGGAKVTALLQSPAADGLYARGINMSGVITSLTDCTGSGEPLARALMDELGLTDVQELEAAPWPALAAAYLKVKPALEAAGQNVGCAPFRNRFYAGDPLACGFRAQTAQLPLLVGSVYAEFSGFMPPAYDRRTLSEADCLGLLEEAFGQSTAAALLPLFRAAYPHRRPADLLLLDTLFRSGDIAYIRARAALNRCTWSYLFDVDFRLDGGCPAWHCADIPYVFHNTQLVPACWGDPDVPALEQLIFDTVMAFARTGDPNHAALPAWPASTPTEEHTLLFGPAPALRTNHDHALIPALAAANDARTARLYRQNKDLLAH